MAIWMVMQNWELPNGVVAPIRSVVECDTETEAEAGAHDAVKEALIDMIGELIGKPATEPIVLYQVG